MTATLSSATEAVFANRGTVCERGDGLNWAASCGAVTVGLIECGDDGVGEAKEKVRIPRQLWRMVEALLENNAYQQPGLFVEKGLELEVQGIQEAVDSRSEFPPHGAHSMSEVRGSVATPPG